MPLKKLKTTGFSPNWLFPLFQNDTPHDFFILKIIALTTKNDFMNTNLITKTDFDRQNVLFGHTDKRVMVSPHFFSSWYEMDPYSNHWFYCTFTWTDWNIFANNESRSKNKEGLYLSDTAHVKIWRNHECVLKFIKIHKFPVSNQIKLIGYIPF